MNEPQNMTAETILSDDVFLDLFALDDLERTRKKQELEQRAKDLGVKRQFLELYKSYERVFRRGAELALRHSPSVHYIQWKDEPLCIGKWKWDDSGIHRETPVGEQYACCLPILPVRRLYNIETHKEKIEIAYNKTGIWRTQIFDKSVVLNASKIVGAMADYGIMATSENARALVSYLADVESQNMDTIPFELSTSRLGWMPDDPNFRKFRPYDKTVQFDSESCFASAHKAIRTQGSLEKYTDLLYEIRQRPRKEPMLLVAASLASVLIKPLGLLPFILHLYGEAGKGKTVATMLAASVWGDPNEDGYISDPKNTATVFEIYLDFLNNLPFICDDLSKLKQVMSKKDGDFSDFIYFLAGGTGKKRSNQNLGVQRMTNWCNCSITNAEKPITSETSNGGELLRVIELETAPGVVFDDGQQGKRTADTIRANFGFMGKVFIEVIAQIGIPEIKRIHGEFVERIRAKDTKNEKEGKQVQSMAAILTADKLFTDYIMQDGVYLDFDFCFRLIRSNKSMSDNERAYEYIINECQIHQKCFEVGENEPPERWGYIRDNAYLINPNIFSRIAAAGNFSKKMFVEWAVRKGLSETNPGRIDKRIRMNGTLGAFVVVKMPRAENEPEQVDMDDLPF